MTQANTSDDDMLSEIDFSGGTRGKFYQADATLNLPVYLDAEVQSVSPAWLLPKVSTSQP